MEGESMRGGEVESGEVGEHDTCKIYSTVVGIPFITSLLT